MSPPKTADQRRIIIGRRYNREKKQGKRTDLTSCQSGTKLATADQRRIIIGRRYNREKNNQPFKGNQHTKCGGGKNCHLKTSESLAKENQVSPRTVRNYAKDAELYEEVQEQ